MGRKYGLGLFRVTCPIQQGGVSTPLKGLAGASATGDISV